MHWSDSAIILAIRRHGETSAIVRVFARDHGVVAGVVRGAFSKSQRGIMQVGNCVAASWSARLPEQMGSFKFEAQRSFAAHAMQQEHTLAMLSSACSLLEQALPERHPYPALYDALLMFLENLSTGESQHSLWQDYLRLELLMLAETGYGLDLSSCAATSKTTELIYVSPKSGRAVSREAGDPYKDRLLKLPPFFRPREGSDPADGQELAPSLGVDLKDGLALTGYFLQHWLLEANGKKVPPARARLQQILYKAAESL